MLLWSRLRQSRFKFHVYSNEFKRSYQSPSPIIANQYISSRKFVPVFNYPNIIVQDERLALFQSVRFYAKPVKPKYVEKDESEPRLNEDIVAPTIRLVMDEDSHCIIPRHEALARAKSLKLDLVEVDRNGKPPVCKIYDYNKQKYLKQTKEKERAKSKSTLRSGAAKEIRFSGKIKPNDLKIKADMVKRLMEKGYRVKCTATDVAADNYQKLLSQFTALIDDIAVVESQPKFEKKQAFLVVRHAKYGPPKKAGKKASATADSSQTSEDSDEDAQTTNAQTKKDEWAVFDGEDDSENPIFDIGSEESSRLVDRNARRLVEPPTASPPRIPVSMNNARTVLNQVNQTRTVPNQVNQTRAVPNQVNQTRAGMDTPPRMRPGQQAQVPPRAGMDTPPRMRPGQQAQVPPRGILKQESSDPNTPAKSYGIFSTPKATPSNPGQNAATTNRYQQSRPSDSTRNPRPNGAPPQRASPAADSSSGQGRWGIFSADKKENQAQNR